MLSAFLTIDFLTAEQETPLEQTMRTRFDDTAEKMRLAMTTSDKASFDSAMGDFQRLNKVDDFRGQLSRSISKSFFSSSWTWYLAAVNTSPEQFFKDEFKSQFWGLLTTEEWLELFNREFRAQCLNESGQTSRTKDNTQSGNCSKLANIYQHYVEHLQQNSPDEIIKVAAHKGLGETFLAIQKHHLQSEDRDIYVSRLALEPMHKAMSLYKNGTDVEYLKALDEYASVNRSLRQELYEYQRGRDVLLGRQDQDGTPLAKNHEKSVVKQN